MRVPYYPGCSLKKAAKIFEISAIESAKVLDVELVELPKWYCCGTIFPVPKDRLLRFVPSVRSFLGVNSMINEGLIERGERRLITLCSECYNTLYIVNKYLKEDTETLKMINEFIGREYDTSVEVTHYLKLLEDIGFDKVAEKVKSPLRDFKVAPYYGCLLLRPREVAFDDPESPKLMEELVNALGAEVIKSPYRTACCGSYITVSKSDIVAERAYEILTNMKEDGANIVAVTCPLCFFNLDYRQEKIKELHPEFGKMPIVYFTQLIALALGMGKDIHGIELKAVAQEPKQK